jgi:indolepyruvate ferredoxin oxidoreductase beta subunit
VKCDVILAGVGGQGTLSIAAIIARAAVDAGLVVRQSEVHGMAQRGGAVLAHLRMARGPIASDLVPEGGADIIISMEPLESLRYAAWLNPEGVLVSSADPFINIPDYPACDDILSCIRRFPRHVLVQAAENARKAGNIRTVNVVMIGAASPFLPLSPDAVERAVAGAFGAAPEIAAANREAFRRGREAAANKTGAV